MHVTMGLNFSFRNILVVVETIEFRRNSVILVFVLAKEP